jgi:hypothetical protein
MQIRLLILVTALVVVGCRQAAEPPSNETEAARSQAELSTDAEQARLWRELAEAGGAEGLAAAAIERGAVQQRAVVISPERSTQAKYEAFPEGVESALAILSLPEMAEDELTMTAQVVAADGEFLTLDLGDQGTLQVQAKVGGRSLMAAAGESAQVRVSRGNPFERNDFLSIQLERETVLHALVGGAQPVRISAPELLLTATQTGEVEGNTMAVAVQVSRANARVLQVGEQTEVAGLTVKVLASIAVQGEAAYALPGEPYRLEILAWRGR